MDQNRKKYYKSNKEAPNIWLKCQMEKGLGKSHVEKWKKNLDGGCYE
jgi:hypothetical protein